MKNKQNRNKQTETKCFGVDPLLQVFWCLGPDLNGRHPDFQSGATTG